MLSLAITSWLRRNILGSSLGFQWLGLCVSTAGGMGSIPGWGMKIPQTMWHGQKKKKKRTLIAKWHELFLSLYLCLLQWDSVALPNKRLNLFLNSLNSGLSCDMICPEEWGGRDRVTVTSLGLKTPHIALLALETQALPGDKLSGPADGYKRVWNGDK